MTILKNIVVTNGTYTTRDGQEKKRYVTIGHVHEGQHGEYITLDAHVNLAGFERKQGDTRVFANLYDADNKRQRQETPQDSGPNDDIPW